MIHLEPRNQRRLIEVRGRISPFDFDPKTVYRKTRPKAENIGRQTTPHHLSRVDGGGARDNGQIRGRNILVLPASRIQSTVLERGLSCFGPATSRGVIAPIKQSYRHGTDGGRRFDIDGADLVSPSDDMPRGGKVVGERQNMGGCGGGEGDPVRRIAAITISAISAIAKHSQTPMVPHSPGS
ncbi:MAG: hypothetical protein BWY17_04837 [Deltaproteobacteria bacterium ADurb.Bin207]|nr:MAG: hypothetical protein BWY17_04837 [Deltaproteobacteria bacterium ADurb.Bin207]